MKYEWLLFDLDNTLLDFDATERYALGQALDRIGIFFEEEHLEIYEKINKVCWEAFENGTMPQAEINKTRFDGFLKALKRPEINAIDFGNYYLNQLAEGEFLLDGAIELLEKYKKTHQLGIVTNGLKEVQRPKLDKNKLTHYFEVIVVSDEIGVAKPHQPFFDYTFEQMKFPSKEKVLIIGDSLKSDIKGGLNYGIDTCWHNLTQKENTTSIKPTYEITVLEQLNLIL